MPPKATANGKAQNDVANTGSHFTVIDRRGVRTEGAGHEAPAWPTRNAPMKPFTRFRLTQRMILMPMVASTSVVVVFVMGHAGMRIQ